MGWASPTTAWATKRAYGVMQLIDSIPPQTTTSCCPDNMALAPVYGQAGDMILYDKIYFHNTLQTLLNRAASGCSSGKKITKRKTPVFIASIRDGR